MACRDTRRERRERTIFSVSLEGTRVHYMEANSGGSVRKEGVDELGEGTSEAKRMEFQ